MPEGSRYRARVPVEARASFSDALRVAYAGKMPEIWDFQASVPDEGFLSACHLNRKGREIFSPILGKRLREAQP